MPHPVRLVQHPAITTAVIRARVARTELARFVPAACGEVWSHVRSAGLKKPGRHVALYGAEDGWVEVGVEIGEAFVGNGRVCCSELPSGAVAATTHLGPYHHLGAAHTAIREWCAGQRHALSGVCWEIYDHWQDEWNRDPSLIRTEVFHRLRTQPASARSVAS